MSVTIYHNPDCGTSRNTLAMIRQSGVEPTVIEYLKTPPSRERLKELISAMGISCAPCFARKVRPTTSSASMTRSGPTSSYIVRMLAHPILINRPIVVTPKGVKLCRPSEAVLNLLPNPHDPPLCQRGWRSDRRRVTLQAHQGFPMRQMGRVSAITAVVDFRQSANRHGRKARQRNRSEDQQGRCPRVGTDGNVDGHQDTHEAEVEGTRSPPGSGDSRYEGDIPVLFRTPPLTVVAIPNRADPPECSGSGPCRPFGQCAASRKSRRAVALRDRAKSVPRRSQPVQGEGPTCGG